MTNPRPEPHRERLITATEAQQVAAELLPWRIGRHVGRTIYAQLGAEPSDLDPLIGVMDTPGLAAEAVLWHNHRTNQRSSER